MTYELFEHTADVGLRVRSPSVERLFEDAAVGLFSMVAPNLNAVRPISEKQIETSEDAYDYLLFDWLNELLYTFETEHLVLVDFDVRIDGYSLQAVGRGELLSAERHGIGLELKAITYHGLKVEQRGGEWLAEVIVDI
ncbi:MAG: archease [Pirellulaceae bacterium]